MKLDKKLLVVLALSGLCTNSFAVEFIENFKIAMGNIIQGAQGVNYTVNEDGTIPSGVITLPSNKTTAVQIPADQQNPTPLFITSNNALNGSNQQALYVNPNFSTKTVDVTGPMGNLVTAKIGAAHNVEKNGVVIETVQDIDIAVAEPSGTVNNNTVAVMIPQSSVFSVKFMYQETKSGQQFTNVPNSAGLMVYVGGNLIYMGNVYFNAVYDANSQENIRGYNYAMPLLPNGFAINPVVPSGTTNVLTYIDLPASF